MIRRLFLVALLSLISMQAHAAREAAFLSPGAGNARSDEAIGVEPKNEIDLGETALNTGRRTTVFFVNMSAEPVGIVDMSASSDSNVRSNVVDDDCTKQGKIAVESRCSVTVETTPISTGPWTMELVLTHKGAGRLARVKLMGKTTGAGANEKRESGLSLSTKDIKPVDFGEVEVGRGKAARSALMINDSSEPITLLSIEVIAAENGLLRLDQGCEIDQELKPGESCPVTLVWKPENKGTVSTDLIIRHTGKLGFAVIPIRGTAKEGLSKDGDGKSGKSAGSRESGSSSGKPPMSPTADDLEKMISGGVAPISAGDIPSSALSGSAPKPVADDAEIHLIGTVGNRAVFYLPDGSTSIVALGEKITVGGKSIQLMNVMAREAEITVDAKKKMLPLEAASALTSRASQKTRDTSSRSQNSGPSGGGNAGSSSPQVRGY